MHALLFGSMSHLNFIRVRQGVPSRDISRRLHHKVETLRLVNQELLSPNLENIDEVLLAVLAQSTNEVELVKRDMKYTTPFKPPFADAQWLSVYGSVSQNKAHVAGLISLVKLRGGVDKIGMPGLASIIS